MALTEFHIAHIDGMRIRCRAALLLRANHPFEPAARRVSHKGRRAYAGERPTAAVARRIAFRSRLERDSLLRLKSMMLDYTAEALREQGRAA